MKFVNHHVITKDTNEYTHRMKGSLHIHSLDVCNSGKNPTSSGPGAPNIGEE